MMQIQKRYPWAGAVTRLGMNCVSNSCLFHRASGEKYMKKANCKRNKTRKRSAFFTLSRIYGTLLSIWILTILLSGGHRSALLFHHSTASHSLSILAEGKHGI